MRVMELDDPLLVQRVIAVALLSVHETVRRELAGFEKRVRSSAQKFVS